MHHYNISTVFIKIFLLSQGLLSWKMRWFFVFIAARQLSLCLCLLSLPYVHCKSYQSLSDFKVVWKKLLICPFPAKKKKKAKVAKKKKKEKKSQTKRYAWSEMNFHCSAKILQTCISTVPVRVGKRHVSVCAFLCASYWIKNKYH